jgi:hypothetical protein
MNSQYKKVHELPNAVDKAMVFVRNYFKFNFAFNTS